MLAAKGFGRLHGNQELSSIGFVDARARATSRLRKLDLHRLHTMTTKLAAPGYSK